MFTPEFVNDERGEFILVANHSLASDEAIRLSIEYNIARIETGSKYLPPHLKRCRLIYDIRGQNVSEATARSVRHALEGLCVVEFKN